ncbi:MAG: FAD-dependent oxidoreductase [Pseudomonadota bacterium]
MADVTIRGAGILGLATAWTCLAKGARVRVIDPNGVASGASGGPVGALAPHTPDQWNAKKAFQFESLILSRSFWPEVEAASGLNTGYRRSGRIQPIAVERQISLAEAREEGAHTHWGAHATWSVVGRADLPGWCPPSPTSRYIHDTLSAQIQPTLACQALAEAVVRQGGEVVREGPNEGAVIHATGWQGLIELSDALGAQVGSGQKGQAIRVMCDAPTDAAQLFVDGLHIISHGDGSVAIGSTSERDFENPTSTDAQADALLERAQAAMPALCGAPILSRWAGVRPRAASRAPVLDRWPGRANTFILNGGFKIGFGMAPGLARVLTDWVLEGSDVGVPEEFRLAASLPKVST